MEYNYVRAKFYIIFPYYLTFNAFKPHSPLAVKEEDMRKLISEHLDGLKSTKEKGLEKWIDQVELSIESRIHLSKLHTLMDVAKQNKYEVP